MAKKKYNTSHTTYNMQDGVIKSTVTTETSGNITYKNVVNAPLSKREKRLENLRLRQENARLRRDGYFIFLSSSRTVLGLILGLILAVTCIKITFSYGGLSPFDSYSNVLNSSYEEQLEYMAKPVNGLFGFDSLLNVLENCPQIEMSLSDYNQVFSIVGDWGVFDSLRLFINGVGSAVGFVVWLVSCILNVITFIVYFVSYLFGV